MLPFTSQFPLAPQGALTAATAGPKEVEEDPTQGTNDLAAKKVADGR